MIRPSIKRALEFALSSRPMLVARVDQLVRDVKVKHHETLGLIAGYMESYGYLSPRWVVGANSPDYAVNIEAVVLAIVKELQEEGILPKTIPFVTMSWYVLHWVVVPFIRSLLKMYIIKKA